MITRQDIPFIGLMAAGLLAVLCIEHRRLTAPALPEVDVNVGPEPGGSLGLARDANIPLVRNRDAMLPTVAVADGV